MRIKGKWNNSEYRLITKIGSGNFGKVYKVTDGKGNIKAMKISKDLLSITNEYNAMTKLKGLSFIPNVYDFDDLEFKSNIYHFIIMDYISGNNLKELGIHRKIDSNKVFKIGKVLINILKKINGLGYRYTDVKLENIIIDEKGRVYFIDFGSLVGKNKPTKEYTPTYNINSWNVGYEHDKTVSILFSVTMIMVSLLDGKEYNPLICNLKQIINKIDRFSLGRRKKQFLKDGLNGKYLDFNQYNNSLSLLLNGRVSPDNMSKIDYLLIISIVSFVFVLIFGIKSVSS